MKRIFIMLMGGTGQPDPTFIAPGIWSMPDQSDKVFLIVLNQTPNQNQADDWGGYNIIDSSADTYEFSNGYSVSVKQAVNMAAEFAETPPKGVLANYRTLQMAATALWNGTNVQGVMLFDNI